MEDFSINEIERLEELEKKYNENKSYLDLTEVMIDNKLFRFYQKENERISKVVNFYFDYKSIIDTISFSNKMLDVSNEIEKIEIRNEIEKLQKNKIKIIENIKKELFNLKDFKNEISQVELTSKNCSFESLKLIEDTIIKFCKKLKYKIKKENENSNEIIFVVSGIGSYQKLKKLIGQCKFVENKKENVAFISVLNKDDKVLKIDEKDFKIETLKSSGAGGQHINKTESAVRVTYLPTGDQVKCEDERSQVQNKERAIELIKQKINKKIKENKEKNIKNQRKNIKNALFATTPAIIFDFDKNKFILTNEKTTIKVQDAISGDLPI